MFGGMKFSRSREQLFFVGRNCQSLDRGTGLATTEIRSELLALPGSKGPRRGG
jgi:hypothetical protein